MERCLRRRVVVDGFRVKKKKRVRVLYIFYFDAEGRIGGGGREGGEREEALR